MKKLIKFFCVVLIALSATLPAIAADGDDFTYEGITYTVISEADKTCETKEGWVFPGNDVAGDIVIPETVYNIDVAYTVVKLGNYAFSRCSDLTSVVIPNSVTSIGSFAFSSCTCVTEFYSYSVLPPVCGELALNDIDKPICTLYVPAESLDEYKAADQWKDFNHIQAIVAEIRLDKTEASIKVGETLQLTATVLPEEAAGAVLTWSSSDESIATVSETGLVTAVSLGTATITVASGNVTAACTVEVTDGAGIDGVFIDGDDNVEVYTLQGVRLNISTREELSELTPGIYIVNGKKVYVK